ncbi:MAG: hypothetical protein ABSC60_13855, partial [Acidobacteriota bacterium]
ACAIAASTTQQITTILGLEKRKLILFSTCYGFKASEFGPDSFYLSGFPRMQIFSNKSLSRS